MAVLGLRTVLQNLITLGANVFLARWLDRADFGAFGILQFAMSFFRLVADTGLAAALVQQKKAPEEPELSTLWWLQLGLGVVCVGASFVAAHYLPVYWQTMPTQVAWLLPGLAVGLLFSMLQTIPFLIMERDVRFGWVGSLEFLGTVTFYGTALVLAAKHAGAASLVCASVGQAAVVSVIAHLVQPWKPKLRFEFGSVRHLLKFGIAFQGGNAVGFLNTGVTPLLVGGRLGADAFGTIQFAETTGFFPSVIVLVVRRVYFPFLSRLQGDLTAFRQEFERAVALCAAPTFFFFGLFAGAAHTVVTIIYGPKWGVAAPALIVYSLGFCFVFFSYIGDAAMAALDDMPRLFRIKAFTAVVSWTGTLVAIWWVPTPFSFAIGYLVHLIVNPLLIYLAIRHKLPALHIFGRLGRLTLPAVLIAVVGRAVASHVRGVWTLGALVLCELVVFSGAALAVDPDLRELSRRFLSRRGPVATDAPVKVRDAEEARVSEEELS